LHVSNIEQSIDVNGPVSTACNRWTQFAKSSRASSSRVGDAVGVARARIRGDIDRFESFIEQRGRETGARRGSINAPHS
jgi:hypothetical protein